MPARLTTIISDAQPGAARGALDAALELGLAIGGRGLLGCVPEAYREHMQIGQTARMAARINVQNGDGTLIVSIDPDLHVESPGGLSDAAAEHQRKASLHIVLPAGGGSDLEGVRGAVVQWLRDEKIRTLHVAGALETEEPGIQQAVHDALVWILEDERPKVTASERAAQRWSQPSDPEADARALAALQPTVERAVVDYAKANGTGIMQGRPQDFVDDELRTKSFSIDHEDVPR